jgi:hypothetical protein
MDSCPSWILLTRGVYLTTHKKRQLNALFAWNSKVMKAYLLKESLDRLWALVQHFRH